MLIVYSKSNAIKTSCKLLIFIMSKIWKFFRKFKMDQHVENTEHILAQYRLWSLNKEDFLIRGRWFYV